MSTYYLHLTLREGAWNRNFTTYGCSIGGPYLWILGFPVSYGSVQIDLDVELKDSSNRSLGKKSFRSEVGLTEWIYTPHRFLKRLPEAYAQLSPQIRSFVLKSIKNRPVAKKIIPPEKELSQAASARNSLDPTAEKLKKLELLLKEGVLTEEEYRQKRQSIIDTL